MIRVFETVDENMQHLDGDCLLVEIDFSYAISLLKSLHMAVGMEPLRPGKVATVTTIPLVGRFREPNEDEIQCAEEAARLHASNGSDGGATN